VLTFRDILYIVETHKQTNRGATRHDHAASFPSSVHRRARLLAIPVSRWQWPQHAGEHCPRRRPFPHRDTSPAHSPRPPHHRGSISRGRVGRGCFCVCTFPPQRMGVAMTKTAEQRQLQQSTTAPETAATQQSGRHPTRASRIASVPSGAPPLFPETPHHSDAVLDGLANALAVGLRSLPAEQRIEIGLDRLEEK